ncbi:hypothetical protein EMWEY_00060230 [Eimeria maxima]|uniref:Uncharacterized protein n=1 Tax=Eimeria maxima TaxID=5804 RepID=U6MAX2_EIMMA|nr:hypothetical protein EMWEY_00060230 [Eimeria maxima]CDJ60198.1 hypothetical protein EMWEY_00060230 [Eimeria maxima]
MMVAFSAERQNSEWRPAAKAGLRLTGETRVLVVLNVTCWYYQAVCRAKLTHLVVLVRERYFSGCLMLRMGEHYVASAIGDYGEFCVKQLVQLALMQKQTNCIYQACVGSSFWCQRHMLLLPGGIESAILQTLAVELLLCHVRSAVWCLRNQTLCGVLSQPVRDISA